MFDVIEQRINQAVLGVFSNTTALINASSVNGIFDEAVAPVDFGLAGIAATAPQFTCATAALPTIAEGDPVVIRGQTYRIAVIPPDDNGMTILELKK